MGLRRLSDHPFIDPGLEPEGASLAEGLGMVLPGLGPEATLSPTAPAEVGAAEGPEDALWALMATGMLRWDGLVALAEEGCFPGNGPGGVPAALLRAYPRPGAAVDAFDLWAEGVPEGANAALGAYLDGRCLEGYLTLRNRQWVTSLPDGLRMHGDLELIRTGLRSLPKKLVVTGRLNLEDALITALPADLKVGALNAPNTRFATLPDGFVVQGDMGVSGDALVALPEGLVVWGKLSLIGCPNLNALPAHLSVGELWLGSCGVRRLPEGLRVAGDLHLEHSRLTELPAGLHVKGDLQLLQAPIVDLPEGLRVDGVLTLDRTAIRTLPGNLRLGELSLRHCASWDGRIPADTSLRSTLWTDRHPQGVWLSEWRALYPHGER